TIRMLRQRRLFMKLSLVLGSLWIYVLLDHPKAAWDPTYRLMYGWLEYTDDDGGPVKVCNCSAILDGEREAREQAKLLTITKDFHKSVQIPDEYYINATQDCRNFKRSRKYLTFPLSQEEEDFPLAYSIVVHHKNFERLLRAIYAPQHFYCIHVDKKSDASVVVYSAWPRVQADLNCIGDLYKISTKWKYFINLCGQDFPLKTNLEIVRMLRSLNGGNSLESERMADAKRSRFSYVHNITNGDIQFTGVLKEPPPFNIQILSGNAYIVVNRGFIRSVLEDKRVLALIEWSKDTYSPDEFLWATIQRLPDMSAIARMVKWVWHEGEEGSEQAVYPECQGDHVRAICVYGAGDLQWLIEQRHLFGNKFDAERDPIAVFCLEKYLRQKALAELR
uniref:Beta-1,3-galactosyl-O-glycosyl-glycoprotein beta-1,6-N-acetylglucosaminyltransferase-like n=1 Tax=Labrus bergylta TaxID=56723 RepID=A0A3Q3G201_9LABR